ncbi:MAG TPA: hypothetical protein VHO03_21135 [Ignavibacteriales bacterium]|nr:hypothetical protein [Ignavibacteriales bacterium]
MQSKIVYVVIFLMAFVLTTGGVMLLNQKYENIFKLDFSPRKTALGNAFAQGETATGITANDSAKALIDTTKLKEEWENKIKQQVLDSLSKAKDHEKTEALIAERNRQLDSLNKIKDQIAQYEVKLKSKTAELKSAAQNADAAKDSAYAKWKKEIVKTYEAMDSKMVAKIIQKLNDNLARDILFSIKKKKRAEIISQFSPETAVRLTRMQ